MDATAWAVSRLVDETTAAVGCSFAISSARFGPEMTAICDSSMAQHLGDDLAHAHAARLLDALHERDDDRVGVQVRREQLEVVAQRLARHRHVHLLGAREGEVEPARGAHAQREVHAGKVVAVALGLLDLAGDLGPPRPHDDVGAAVGEDLRERRAPAAGAEHGDALARDLAGVGSILQGDRSPSDREPSGPSARRAPARDAPRRAGPRSRP